jgi:hypothetical protein
LAITETNGVPDDVFNVSPNGALLGATAADGSSTTFNNVTFNLGANRIELVRVGGAINRTSKTMQITTVTGGPQYNSGGLLLGSGSYSTCIDGISPTGQN